MKRLEAPKELMKLQHNLGGLEGLGPVDFEKRVFVEPWETRIFGIHVAMMGLSQHLKEAIPKYPIDQVPTKFRSTWTWADLRKGAEAMNPFDYFKYRYYEKWLGGISGFFVSQGYISQEELDERKSTVAQAEANSAGSAAALEAARLNLNFTRVTSPIAGRVSRAEVTRGNLVTGGTNGGTLLTSVVSVDPMYLYFEGDEQAYLRYGQMARNGERPSSRDAANPVRVGLANEEGFPHTGQVDFVDNQLNPQTGTIRARAVLDNKDGVYTPGMFARVQLLGSSEYSAILIDDRAVNTDQNQKYVLLLEANNQVAYRRVKLGRVIDGLRIVREGLKAGDVIIVNGAQRAHPGITVTPQTVAMGTDAATADTASAPAKSP